MTNDAHNPGHLSHAKSGHIGLHVLQLY